MKKLISGLLIMALSFSLVSVLASKNSFKHDVDQASVTKMDPGSDLYQLAFLNDAVVPEVPTHYTCHTMKEPSLQFGFVPVVQAKARAPTNRRLRCS